MFLSFHKFKPMGYSLHYIIMGNKLHIRIFLPAPYVRILGLLVVYSLKTAVKHVKLWTLEFFIVLGKMLNKCPNLG